MTWSKFEIISLEIFILIESIFAVELPVPEPEYRDPSLESQASQLFPFLIYPSVPIGIGPFEGAENRISLL